MTSRARRLWIAGLIALIVGVSFAVLPVGATGGTATATAEQSASQGRCDGHGRGSIPPRKIGINLVSVWREIFGGFPAANPPLTEEQIDANFWDTMGELSQIGFRGIENIHGVIGTDGLYTGSFKEQRRELKKVGMRTFTVWSLIDAATYPTLLQQGRTLKAAYVGGEPIAQTTVAGALAEAQRLNELGKQAAAHDMKIQVHNHAPAFLVKVMYDTNGDGVDELVPVQEVMMLNTDPRYVGWEVDIHWALVGLDLNQDALVAFLQKYNDRIDMIHVKGTTTAAAWPPSPLYYATDFAAIGSAQDITDWPRVFAALPDLEYYLYEWDFPLDGLQEARDSYAYLECVRF
jgi:sugar phosphate isomerase/epimerase